MTRSEDLPGAEPLTGPGVGEPLPGADATESRALGRAATAAGAALVAALIGIDVVGDVRAGGGWGHAAVELAVMVVAVAVAIAITLRFVGLRERTRVLARHLDAAQLEAARWRREADGVVRGMAAAIDHQFERWQLSPAEREVALLLLKGLAHRQIAKLRDTSERTVRQQSLAIYRKAGLSGRAELSAFFLEDVLLLVERAGRREEDRRTLP